MRLGYAAPGFEGPSAGVPPPNLGGARGCPGSTCISPVWLEGCNTLSLSPRGQDGCGGRADVEEYSTIELYAFLRLQMKLNLNLLITED